MSPGRSGKEFIARLHTLEEFAKTCPLVCEDLYDEGPQDHEQRVGFTSASGVDVHDEPGEDGCQELAAYRPLDVDRLKLTGQGEWDLAEHLHDELWLPYVEPLILRHNQPVDFSLGPNFSLESKISVWQSFGLRRACLSFLRLEHLVV